MAMMAATSPALARLFERIDSAPYPHDEALRGMLKLWQEKRGDVTIPRMEAFDEEALKPFMPHAFIFERLQQGERDYVLRTGSDIARDLLGSGTAGTRLTKMPRPRSAVRFRRLFEIAWTTGEPLMAQFVADDAEKGPSVVEILVAPLSLDGRTTHALLGGLSVRPVGRSAPARPVAERKRDQPLLFAPRSSAALAEQVASHAGLALSPAEERDFEDGEHKMRPLAEVRGREAYVIASLNGDEKESVNDRLCRLLFFIGALKTNGATRVTAVTPYLCYLRKDRQTKPQDPLTGRYVAQLFEAVGTDCLITMEAHNVAALQNAFRIPTVHLDPYRPFARYLAARFKGAGVTVVSPDLGGGKRADAFRTVLEEETGQPVGKAFAEKHRSMGIVSGEMFAGEVAGKKVVIIDDMISSGTTMARVAKECHERGASEIYLAVSHALFSADAGERLSLSFINEILIADTVQPVAIPAALREKVTVVSVAEPFARAIVQNRSS